MARSQLSWSSLFAMLFLALLGMILVAEARPYGGGDIFSSGLLINPQGGSYMDFTGDRRPMAYDPEVLTNT
ncbi:hypothetical protein AAVH_43113, partial [Aphelenchoides avenae]